MNPETQQAVPFAGTSLPFRLFMLAGWIISSLALVLVYCRIVRPDLRFWPGMVTHGNVTLAQVALTFDDGPHPLWLPLIADTLTQHGAHGTFFVVGSQATLYPELIARVSRAGHEIANHSMTHPYPNLGVRSRQDVDMEIVGAADLLAGMTGKPVRDFRPPGGGMNDAVVEILKARQMRLAWWSRNPGDFLQLPPTQIANYLLWHTRNGGVVLLHERKWTVAGLEEYFSRENRDLSFVTFDEIAQHQ